VGVDETPTPKHSDSLSRAPIFKGLAEVMAGRMDDLAKKATAPGPACNLDVAVRAARVARRLRAVGACFGEWGVATPPEQKLSDMGVLRNLEREAEGVVRDWEMATGQRGAR